jgi:D-alanyl-D-alanine carboxypeptidase
MCSTKGSELSMRLASSLILCCVITSVSSAGPQESPRRPESVGALTSTTTSSDETDTLILHRMQRRHIPGVSIAIVRDGKLVKAKGYGLANQELSVTATEHTVYQLASITKTFTATAIMMLVEDGRLSLDDKIVEKLRDLPSAWKAVTVRHLLSHTSGIKSYTSVKHFFKTARKDYSQREILDLVVKEPLEFAPGEKWKYNNTGYFLLGMLIETVSGKAYGDFLNERIFRPLGMTETRVNDLGAVIPNRAQGYSWDGRTLRNGEYVSPTQPFAAGMLVSTVADLVKWDAALGTERLLKKSTLEQMWTPARLNNGTEAEYGFGWGVRKVNGHRLIAHDGGIPGFSTQLSRYIDDRLTVIVLTNADGGHAGALGRVIAGGVVPDLAAKPEEPIADADPGLTRRLQRVIEKASTGEVEPELFAKGATELVTRLRDGKGRFVSFGTLKQFQLYERKDGDQGVHLRYRADFENETVNAIFDLDKSGKIERLGLQPVD